MKSNHKKKKLLKGSISYILAFVLALCLTILLLLIGCKVGVFNSSVLMSQLNKTNYYSYVSATIRENAEDIIRPSGLKEDILDGVIDDDTVYLDTKRVIDAQLEERELTLDTTEIANAFDKNVRDYARANNMTITSETLKGIQDLSNQITSEYVRLTEFPFAEYFVKYQKLFDKVFLPAAVALIIIIVIIASILIKLQHWAHRGVRYIAYGTLASVLMTAIIPVIMLATGVYKKVNVSPEYMYNLVLGIFRWDLIVFVYMALAALIGFAGELLIIKVLKQKVSSH